MKTATLQASILESPWHPNKPLIVEEAASYLRMSVETLRNLRDQGKGPIARIIAGKLIYRVKDLDAWVEDQPLK